MDRGVVEQSLDWQHRTQFRAESSMHREEKERVAAEVEEGVVGSHGGPAEYGTPQRGYPLLEVADERYRLGMHRWNPFVDRRDRRAPPSAGSPDPHQTGGGSTPSPLRDPRPPGGAEPAPPSPRLFCP